MKTQLYTKSTICQSAEQSQVNKALGVLALMGAPARVLGKAHIPSQEVSQGEWIGRPWRSDACPLPPEAWKPLLELYAVGIKPLDVWVFHEKPARKSIQLPSLLDKLPKVDWRAAGQRAQQLGAVVGNDLRKFGVAAAPVVVSVAKATAKVTLAAATVAIPLAIGVIGMAVMAIASDPVLVVIFPSDDAENGGAPVWVEIARWYEE